MIDCTTCAQAIPISACPTTIAVGVVADDAPPIVVRFTDRATGRTTLAEIDEAELPTVVAVTSFDFAPGHAVRVEVLTLLDDGPGAPLEFLPFLADTDGSPVASAYPVSCIVFTPVKSFAPDGLVYPAGPRTLILES